MTELTRAGSRWVTRQGLVGGLTLMFIVAIGMFEVFDNRKVIDPFFSAGYALILWVPLVFGYRAAHRPMPDGVDRPAASRSDILAGATAGALAGLVLGLMVVLVALKPDLRDTFRYLSPAMVDKFSYGGTHWFGLGVLTVGGGVLCALGGALDLLPNSFRRGAATALITVIGFTRCSAATVRTEGSGSPSCRVPSRIIATTRSRIWR